MPPASSRGPGPAVSRINPTALVRCVRRKLATSAIARASAFLLFGSMPGHVGNYQYHVVSARSVGPADFAEVSAVGATRGPAGR